jgi:hypothetical protein
MREWVEFDSGGMLQKSGVEVDGLRMRTTAVRSEGGGLRSMAQGRGWRWHALREVGLRSTA